MGECTPFAICLMVVMESLDLVETQGRRERKVIWENRDLLENSTPAPALYDIVSNVKIFELDIY